MSLITSITQFDMDFSRRLRLRPEQRGWWQLASFLAHSGDSWFWMAGLGIIWLFGNRDWHNRAAMLAISIVVQAITVLAIKFTVKRRRPEGEWGAIYRNTDPHSFPSGHAARALLLVVMAWAMGPEWFRWAVLVWAPLVSLARVLMGVHYISDVLAGWVTGVLIAVIFLQFQPLILVLVPFLFGK
jgi:membrane-associated phospholipid phosphatase